MRSSAETVVFAGATVIQVMLLAAATVCLALIAASPALTNTLSALPGNPWWFSYHDPGPRGSAQPLMPIAAAMAATAAGLAAGFRARAAYHRTRTPILPYLILFLFTLGIECLRSPLAFIVASDRSLPASIVLTRTVYCGRFVGLLSLFVASLHCIELKYRRSYVMGAGALLIALAMAASIPIDSTTFLSPLLWKLGDEQGVWFVNLVISLLVVGAAVGGAFLKHEAKWFALAAGFLCLLAARELLFFGSHPVRLAAGLAALIAGIVLSIRSLSGVPPAA